MERNGYGLNGIVLCGWIDRALVSKDKSAILATGRWASRDTFHELSGLAAGTVNRDTQGLPGHSTAHTNTHKDATSGVNRRILETSS